MKKSVTVALMAGCLFGALAAPVDVAAAPPQHGNCNTLQLLNNLWLTRTANSTQAQGWITSVEASISRYDYELCDYFVVGPNVSSSAAWVAIEGQPTAGNNIVQDGYIKCQTGCVNGFPLRVLSYFWAAGQDDDLFHLPFPVYMGSADSASSHLFTTRLRLESGVYRWEFLVDGVVKATTDDAWRHWNRNRIEIGNEVWNCGDQIGGRSAAGTDAGNKQKFRNVSWRNATAHSGGLGASQRRGNNYPWSFWTDHNTSDFDTWTSAHPGDCSG